MLIYLAVAFEHRLNVAEKSALIEGVPAISGRAVDLIDLKVVGQPLLGQIVKHGIHLVGDDVRYGMLLSKNAFDYADFLPCRGILYIPVDTFKGNEIFFNNI